MGSQKTAQILPLFKKKAFEAEMAKEGNKKEQSFIVTQ